MKELGKRLKQIRMESGLKQGEFAKRIKISQGALSDFEREFKPMAERYIKLICYEFNVNQEWLLTGEGEPFAPTPIPVITGPDDESLNQEEYELINIFRELIRPNKKFLRKQARDLLSTQKEVIAADAELAEV